MGALGKVSLQVPSELKNESFRVAEPALQTLTKRGLDLPERPKLEMNELWETLDNLTQLDDVRLGDLLNKMGNFCSYVDGQLAVADVEREEAQARYDFITARIRMALKEDTDGRKLTVSDKSDIALTRDEVKDAKEQLMNKEAVYKYTRTVRDKAQRAFDTVSRRITQRGQEIERMKREGNVGAVPVTGHHQFRR